MKKKNDKMKWISQKEYMEPYIKKAIHRWVRTNEKLYQIQPDKFRMNRKKGMKNSAGIEQLDYWLIEAFNENQKKWFSYSNKLRHEGEIKLAKQKVIVVEVLSKKEKWKASAKFASEFYKIQLCLVKPIFEQNMN